MVLLFWRSRSWSGMLLLHRSRSRLFVGEVYTSLRSSPRSMWWCHCSRRNCCPQANLVLDGEDGLWYVWGTGDSTGGRAHSPHPPRLQGECKLHEFLLAKAMKAECSVLCSDQGVQHVCKFDVTCQRNERSMLGYIPWSFECHSTQRKRRREEEERTTWWHRGKCFIQMRGAVRHHAHGCPWETESKTPPLQGRKQAVIERSRACRQTPMYGWSGGVLKLPSCSHVVTTLGQVLCVKLPLTLLWGLGVEPNPVQDPRGGSTCKSSAHGHCGHLQERVAQHAPPSAGPTTGLFGLCRWRPFLQQGGGQLLRSARCFCSVPPGLVCFALLPMWNPGPTDAELHTQLKVPSSSLVMQAARLRYLPRLLTRRERDTGKLTRERERGFLWIKKHGREIFPNVPTLFRLQKLFWDWCCCGI